MDLKKFLCLIFPFLFASSTEFPSLFHKNSENTIVRVLNGPNPMEQIIISPALFVHQSSKKFTCFVKKTSYANGSIQYCCEGERPNPYNFTTCEPICATPCRNGYCVPPGRCHCFPGYVRNNGGYCVPTCPIACLNGYCLHNGVCQCKPGYHLDDSGKICQAQCRQECSSFSYCSMTNTCECIEGYYLKMQGKCSPICNPPCGAGMCVKPNVCICPNSKLRIANICITPTCPRGCRNGICVGDNLCACKVGYTLSASQNTCDPLCKNGCQNGLCARPDKCMCNLGYTMIGQQCKPICKTPCFNGHCSSPDTCTCSQGYNFVWGQCRKPLMIVHNPLEQNLSLASPPRSKLCRKTCLNGFCIANDICACNSGYIQSPVDPFQCTAFCSKRCINGECIAPNVCACKPYFRKINENTCQRFQ